MFPCVVLICQILKYKYFFFKKNSFCTKTIHCQKPSRTETSVLKITVSLPAILTRTRIYLCKTLRWCTWQIWYLNNFSTHAAITMQFLQFKQSLMALQGSRPQNYLSLVRWVKDQQLCTFFFSTVSTRKTT